MTQFTPTWPDRERRTVAPGAVHLPGWLDSGSQRRLVEAFRSWSTGPVPIRAASLPGGRRMLVHTVCLGWHWQPYRYTRTADDVNGRPVLPFPDWLGDIGRAVITAAYGHGLDYRPDTALVNFYDADARLGMHQDKDETVDEPVVSLSIGDTCRFRFGNPHDRGKPYTDVDLVSGDAFVFGRESRFAYHGVPTIHPGAAPPASGLDHGRINITMRGTGLGLASADAATAHFFVPAHLTSRSRSSSAW